MDKTEKKISKEERRKKANKEKNIKDKEMNKTSRTLHDFTRKM